MSHVCQLLACCGVLLVLVADNDACAQTSPATSDQVFSTDCQSDLAHKQTFAPEDQVRKEIEQNEQHLVAWVMAGDRDKLNGLLAESMSYVHENGQISTRQEFFDDYLSKGYVEAKLEPKEEMRQFGCTVTTVSRGYFRLKGEAEYPRTAVTHIWVKNSLGRWVLVHRHESHKGPVIGAQLPQSGGVSKINQVGVAPSDEISATILSNEASWQKAMVDNDAQTMDRLLCDSLQYVHVTDHTSTKPDFMYELSTGFDETDFVDTTLRQYGNTVIALHNAHYKHTGKPDQSRSQAMHCWVKFGDEWKIVSRHSARFLPY